MRKWSRDTKPEIIRLYLPPEELSTSEIAKRMGVSSRHVSNVLTEAGIERRPKGLSVHKKREIDELLRRDPKMHMSDISRGLGLHRQTVSRYLKSRTEDAVSEPAVAGRSQEAALPDDSAISKRGGTAVRAQEKPSKIAVLKDSDRGGRVTLTATDTENALSNAINITTALLETIAVVRDLNAFVIKGLVDYARLTGITGYTEPVSKLSSLTAELNLTSMRLTSQNEELLEAANKLRRK